MILLSEIKFEGKSIRRKFLKIIFKWSSIRGKLLEIICKCFIIRGKFNSGPFVKVISFEGLKRTFLHKWSFPSQRKYFRIKKPSRTLHLPFVLPVQISVCKRLFLSSLWLGVDSWAKKIIDGQLIPFFRLFQN